MTTLFILPGWTGSYETWNPFIKTAGKNIKDIICINLPCFGGVSCPKEIWGVEQYAEYAWKVIKKYKEENPNKKITILGHSFGGQVAVNVISANPLFFNNLILIGAAIIRPKKYLKRFIFFIISKIGKLFFEIPIFSNLAKIARKILYRITGSSDYLNSCGVQRSIFKKITHQDFRHLLPKISIPTLVVWGREDKQTKLSHGKKIAKLLQNAELKIIDNGGHGLHKQNTEELANIICKFIKKYD